MDALTAARAQMEMSLAFHMVFAALGIGLPLLMVVAEGIGLRTGRPHWRAIARTWGKATALLFVVGAVSGTALSFELGLLWPKFLRFAGPVVGPAFTLEGYAFFTEAIFVGLYLYGWERLSPRAHWLAGIPVALSGLASGVIVVAANAWMQVPGGFAGVEKGRATGIDPLAAFESPAWLPMAVHSSISCYEAVGFAVAGVYAVAWLRGRREPYHRSALVLSATLGAIAALAQPISGHFLGHETAANQPGKLAAMEALFETRAGAPLLVGGVPDPARGVVRWGLEIPRGLSFLATGDPGATIRGWNELPPDARPNPILCHFAFQIMVGLGTLLALVGVAWLVALARRRATATPLVRAIAVASPLGFVALEAGWVVTEAGRQPWIVQGVMRTADAVTPAAGVQPTFFAFTALYVGLGAVLVALLRALAHAPSRARAEEGAHVAG